MDAFLSLLLTLPFIWCCGIRTCQANVFSDIKNTAEKAGEGIKHAAEKTGAFVKDTAETWKKDLEAAKEKATKDTRFYTFAIIKPYLFLGGFFSLNKKNIEQYGITANVNAGHPLGKRKIITKYHLEYKQIGVSDFPTENIGKYFQDTTAWMEAERQKFGGKGRIWVNCFEGVSRSASIVVAYLVRYDERKWTADQYIEHIKKDHRKIRINDGFKKQLHEWENQVKSFNPNERHKSVQGQEKIGARPVAPLNMEQND